MAGVGDRPVDDGEDSLREAGRGMARPGWPTPDDPGPGDGESLRIPPAELAQAIAEAFREVAPAIPRRGRRRSVDADRIGAATWALIAGGAALGGMAALVVGAILGLSLSGYLAAPHRGIEIAAAAVAALGVARGVVRVRRALRGGSWGALGGAALDFALALSAVALAVGVRP
jgi:hypothetical protein